MRRVSRDAEPKRQSSSGETTAGGASPFLPERRQLGTLSAAAAGCRGCPLWRDATQVVFGDGDQHAPLMLVGEMPGDREDLSGQPFVGPAGQLLDDALERAGIARDSAYVTNVVKHFKWAPRGRRRLHRTPSASEIAACLPWLQAEIELVRPRVLVCLGATAAKALLGRSFLVSRERGRFVESELAPSVTATVHPSSLLRMREPDARRGAMEQLVADFSKVKLALDEQG